MDYCAPRLQDQVLLHGQPRRLGLLGGTFNPIHNGHLLIGQKAAEEFGLDKVYYLVAGDPPHKNGPEVVPKEVRYRLVQKALAPYPQLEPNAIELCRDGPSYTVDTLAQLRTLDPQAQYYFIIGQDTLYQLEHWHEFPELARLTDFICLGRPMDPQAVNPALQAKILEDRYGARIHLSDYCGPDITSTEIRDRISRGESVKGLVPTSVEEEIYGAGLYQQQGKRTQSS